MASAVNPAASAGIAVAAAGTAHVKGSWVELFAATAFDADRMVVSLHTMEEAGVVTALVDLAVGGAGSEVVVVENLLVSAGVQTVGVVDLPLHIPAGSRVAARAQASTISVSTHVTARIMGGGWGTPPPAHRVVTYGAVTADSGGTEVDPGGTAHTKGAWAQLAASTTAAHTGLMLGVGHRGNSALRNEEFLVDVGVGAPGSEQIVLADWAVALAAVETLVPQFSPVIPASIPAGSRLAVRAQCNDIDAADRLLDYVLYGVS
jgi:hypothetical protein